MPNSIAKTAGGSGHLVFLLGHPLGHSLSPEMQNAAFRVSRLPWLYVPLDVTRNRLREVMAAMEVLPVVGANVTVPFKGDVIPHLDWVEREADWLGSVNTIFRKGKKLCGASTDGEGFLRSLGPKRKKLKGSRGLLLGAGGAARSVAGALAGSGVKWIGIANRSPQRAADLARSLSGHYRRLDTASYSFKEAERVLPHCDWVIQATSLGLKKGDSAPLSLRNAGPSLWVVDLIYHRTTEFLEQARVRRLPRLNGVEMLLHQGALSFEKWTGRKAPLGIMRRELRRRLGSF